MFGIRKWRFSAAIAVASLLSLCSLHYLDLFYLLPFHNNLRIPLPNHVTSVVHYRNAPWKPEIGRWLSDCRSNLTSIQVTESVGEKSCKNGCSKQGNCNYELGECRCFHGFTGEECSETVKLECNYPSESDKEPYGPYVYSICAAYCDVTQARCFCGEGTKYPSRPLPERCGFKMEHKGGGVVLADWSTRDENIFTTNGSEKGWCNVDPVDAYASLVEYKTDCDCRMYDGFDGELCELPLQTVCINQCSGHGYCRGGSCQCENTWYGVDCSVPSISSDVANWPKWLQPSEVRSPGNILPALSEKKIPLVYVYDLPAEYTSLILEGRHYKHECVNRVYDSRNGTFWTHQLYGSQMALYESLLASSHRTLNGDEADYYFVPVFDSWIIPQVGQAPHLARKGSQRRSEYTFEIYKRAYDHIMMQYPYWNRSSGNDHIWSFAWDEGACMAPKEIWNGIMLVHWGNTNTKHKNSTTAYDDDNWNSISEDRRGNHSCFDPIKDIVLPAWKNPDEISFAIKHWATTRQDKKILFYFNGNLGAAYKGRPEDRYSMGIRQKIGEEFGSTPNKKGKLGKQHADDVIVVSESSANYEDELGNSTFCGVFPGDGWSGRMEDSILHGCIPVIIQDGVYLPYENVFHYESLAVRILEKDIPNMIHILKSIDKTEIEMKQWNIRRIFQRFLYRDSIMLEAQRQKDMFGIVDDWATQFSQFQDDDVFATVMQVLHYKLHNDPWRREFVPVKKKEFGVPPKCVVSP